MRVLLSSVGTRGDVQPIVALALALRGLGMEVRLCAPPNFASWMAALDLDIRPVGIEMRAPPPGAAPVKIPDLITDQFDTVSAAAEGCEAILGGGAHQYAARSVAEARGIPYVGAVYAPVSLPSPDLPPPGAVGEPGDPAANLRLWEATRAAWNERALERVNTNRARLGLPGVDDVLGHILGVRPWLAADATLGPAPATPGLRVHQAGAWILPDTSALPTELEAFLQAGDAPVYLGFGSMPAAGELGRTLVAAARAAGRRVLLSRGWAELGPGERADDCCVVDDVNHQALFPRVAAVVHHGGAGTTTTAARAGVPQVAVPMFSDQFYWARRLRELGIGTAVSGFPPSVETLSAAIRAALEPACVARAQAVAPAIATDGAERTARLLVRLSE